MYRVLRGKGKRVLAVKPEGKRPVGKPICRGRKQRTGGGKCCFVNRTLKLRNKLPAEQLATFLCQPRSFRKRVSKAFIGTGNSSGWRNV
jgi:hypothetical protein